MLLMERRGFGGIKLSLSVSFKGADISVLFGDFGVHFGRIRAGWVHLGLLRSQLVNRLLLYILEDAEVRLFEHRLDLEQVLLEKFEVLSHHGKEVSLGSSVESGCIHGVLLDNLVEEEEGVFSLGEAALIDQSLVSTVRELIELFLEGSPPRDAILFFLLLVLAWHVGGVVKESDVPLHHFLAELASRLGVLPVDVFVDEALGAQCHASCLVIVLFGVVVVLAQGELFGGA